MSVFVFAAGFLSGALVAAVFVGYWLFKRQEEHFGRLMAQVRCSGQAQ